jgi:hypothetical protein
MTQAGDQEQVSPEARHWLDRVMVDDSVRELCPGYTALVIVAEGLRPGPGTRPPARC